MDDIVKQALVKWPHVPACWGWLGLDGRGNWWLRDDATQQLGAFPAHKGEQLVHEKLLAFIGRNYEADAQGNWFFQNGPQRVYVELEAAPMVWRVDALGQIAAHTGRHALKVQQCVCDEQGLLYLQCDGVLGQVHTQDMVHAAELLEREAWIVTEMRSSDLEAIFGFVRHPQKDQ